MLALSLLLLAQAPQPGLIDLKIDGVDRQAFVFAPAQPSSGKPPVLIMFHGHGGSAERCISHFHLEKVWPQAIVVYPDGLPVNLGAPGLNGKGWALDCSDKNRDIKFFDALRKTVLDKYHGDSHKVFACGFSNGGMFMYTLWALRPNDVAAFCVSGGCLGTPDTHLTIPKPCFITISGNDETVPVAYQTMALDAAKEADGSAPSGMPYGDEGTMLEGKKPVVVWGYEGGHEFPFECYPQLVRFFESVAGK